MKRHPRSRGTPRQHFAVVCALLLCISTGAFASEQSELLYSRGLVAFHAGRFDAALKLFDEAVAADPTDAYAHYYRGMTYGRRGEWTPAIADLRAAVAAKPDLEPAPLELGVALVEAGQYRDAIEWLERAQRDEGSAARASLFLGIAHLRLDDRSAARTNLERAARDSALRQPAQYYLGIIAYQEHDWPHAREHFEAAKATGGDSEMAREATTFLGKLGEGERPRGEIYGALGIAYDSNVSLAPSDQAIKNAAGISGEADGLVTLFAGARYAAWRSERVEFSIGYEFFQSLHFKLDDFNLQDQRPYLQLLVNWDPLKAGVLAHYDYYLLRDDSFLQEGTVLHWIDLPEGNFGRSEIYYRMHRQDYFLDPFAGLLDSFDHAAGAHQFVYLGAPERFLSVGYQFDHLDPINAAGDPYGYDGNEVNTNVGWMLPAGTLPPLQQISTEAGFAYRHERYASQSDGRRDDVYLITGAAETPITDHISLTLAYLGTINNSNDAAFTYDRNIVSLSLGVRF
ncbi:MAG: tetratricopeptide repeat protein [Deltaproteobacteria bacterium]|nr:tetratricopeptide repeat protein [Deltaproteobacteria bacterium]MBI3386833.1 tetratricopeptide repeat protein [Deltaproteobacteria bacterium]